MSRLEVSAHQVATIGRSVDRVWAFVSRLPEAMALFPSITHLEEVEAGSRYAIHLGPFGVGRLRGTVRSEVHLDPEATSADRRELRIGSVDGRGNTDVEVVVRVEPIAGGEMARLHAAIWASPRREIPAYVPAGLVRRIADATLAKSLEEGVRNLRREIEGSAGVEEEPRVLSPEVA